MSRIIFIPVCEKCGHEFEELYVYYGFSEICPCCGELIEEVSIVSPDNLVRQDEDGFYLRYHKNEVYPD